MSNPGFTYDERMYDFELFLPSQKKSLSNTKKHSESAQHKKKTKLSSRFINTTITLLILLLLFSNLYMTAAISETVLKIEKSKKDIVYLNAEITRLEAQLLSDMSYATIEQKAAEMGMGKCRRDQVKYVNIHEES